MGLASLDGVTFRLDPHTITWSYTIKTADTPTVGGKVVQVFGATLGDMVVQGQFGKGGWEEQQQFLDRMKAIGDKQVADAHQINSTAEPLRFLYPPHGWDFLVYLKAYSRQPGGGRSIRLDDNGEFSPTWALTLFMVENNVGLQKVAQDQFIARLAQGIGWTPSSEFNGPLDFAAVQAEINREGSESGTSFGTIQEYLQAQFGIATTPSGGVSQ